MKVLDRIIQKAQSQNKTIVLSESQDNRILRAASIITERKIARIILIGDESTIQEMAKRHHINLNGIDIINPNTSLLKKTFSQHFFCIKETQRNHIRAS